MVFLYRKMKPEKPLVKNRILYHAVNVVLVPVIAGLVIIAARGGYKTLYKTDKHQQRNKIRVESPRRGNSSEYTLQPYQDQRKEKPLKDTSSLMRDSLSNFTILKR